MNKTRLRFAARVGAIVMLIQFSLPLPVAADNCSGLADCGNTIELLLLILIGVLVIVLIVLAAGEIIAAAAAVEAAEAAAALAAEEAAALAAEEAAALAAEEAAAAAAEEAAAAAAEEAAGAYGPLDPRSWVSIVNGGEGTENCAALSQAMADGFAGDSIPAAVSGLEGPPTTLAAYEAELGGVFQDASAGMIEDAVANAGDQGIVYVAEGDSAHVFNVMNINGDIWYLDAQSGVFSQSIGDVMAASGYSGLSDIMFLGL